MSDNIPKSFKQVETNVFRDEWMRAIEEELDSHRINNTWDIVPKPGKEKTILNTKWVFTVKYSITGEEIAKARLVAIGCEEQYEYDDEELYSPVCPIEITRLMLSIAQERRFRIITMDVITAYLYGILQREIYLQAPLGMNINGQQNALKLNKSLYGLHIASKCWYITLLTELQSIGYCASAAEKCLFFKRDGTDIAFLIIYVDDILLVTNSDKIQAETIHILQSRFLVKICDNPNKYIGMELEREGGEIHLHQKQFITKMAKSFGITEEDYTGTPMEKNLRIQGSETPNTDREYRTYIGTLLYVSRYSRPDISYCVNKLSQFQNYVTPTIKAYARRVMRYLYNTRNAKIVYQFLDPEIFRTFVDASYAPDIKYDQNECSFGDIDARSVSGYLNFHRGNLTNWGTQKQTITATSSAAAEIIAIIDHFDAIVIPRDILIEIFGEETTVQIHEDNSSATMCLKGCKNRKMRHITHKSESSTRRCLCGRNPTPEN